MGAAPTSPAQPPRPRPQPAWLPRRFAPEYVWRAAVFIIALVLLIVIVTRWDRWQGAPGLAVDRRRLPAVRPDADRRQGGRLRARGAGRRFRTGPRRPAGGPAGRRRLPRRGRPGRGQRRRRQGAARDPAGPARRAGGQRRRPPDAVVASTAAQARAERPRRGAAEEALRHRLVHDRGLGEAAHHRRAAARAAGPEPRPGRRRQAPARGAGARRQRRPPPRWTPRRPACGWRSINLGYTRIVAPQDGVLGQRQVRAGQYVGVGGQVTTAHRRCPTSG